MTYTEKTLTQGEHVVYTASLSLWNSFWTIILGIILIPVFGVGLILLLMVFCNFATTELVITNKRLVSKKGFISRRVIEIPLSKVETIRVEQGFMGRILNYGSVVVAGAGNPQEPFLGISKPLEFRQKFSEAQL
jgi:uncharacterized membrane protein YdbT with pleckstrin-like domain